MTNILLLYNNYFDDATLTGGAWAVPLDNIQDPVPFTRARSAGLSATNTKFLINLGASRLIRAPCITHTNLSVDGRYRITWYSDAFSTEAGNSGWASVPGYPVDDPDAMGVSIYHIFDDAVDAQYWRIEFDDASNPDGYIEVGRGYMSDTWEPSLNFGEPNTDGMVANTPRQNSLGGTGYFNRYRPVRSFAFTFPRLPDSELATLRRIRRIANLNKQVVVIPDPDDTTNFSERNILGTLAEMPAIQLLAAGDATIGFTVTESV